jgi:hypothetical protein
MGQRNIGRLAFACICVLTALSACDDREDALREGTEQDDCFSPTRNLDRIQSNSVEGCECDDAVDRAVCVTICDDPSEGSGVDARCDGVVIGLFCDDGQWSWANVDPCRASG